MADESRTTILITTGTNSISTKDIVVPLDGLPKVTRCDSFPKKLVSFLKKSPSLPPNKDGVRVTRKEEQPKTTMSASDLEDHEGESMVPLISSGSYRVSPTQERPAVFEVRSNGHLGLPTTAQPRNSAASLKVHFENDQYDVKDSRNEARDSLISGDGTSSLLYDDSHPRSQSRASTCTAFSFGQDRDEQGQSDEEGSEEGQPKPPDGGYGWVIVFASFLIHLIADGITFSFGVIFTELLDYFKESRGKTAWIASLFMSLPLFLGPIASSMTDRFGCKAVTVVGSVIASAGFILSSFTNSIELLFITFGVIPGIGLSFCYVAAIASVAYYFEARRSLAIGLATCGSGLGTFIFSPLTQLLLDEYGWRGTTLILAGVFLNLAVCGMLMREQEITSQKRETKRRLRYNSQTESVTGSVAASSRPDVREFEDPIKATSDDVRLCTSLVSLPTFVCNGEKVPLEVLQPLFDDPSLYNMVLHLNPQLVIGRSFEDQVNLGYDPLGAIVTSQPGMDTNGTVGRAVTFGIGEDRTKERTKENGKIHSIQPKHLQNHLLKNIRVNKKMLTHRSAMLNLPVYRLRASSCPDLYRNSMVTLTTSANGTCGGLFEDLQIILLEMCDVTNLKNAKFVVFLISNFLLYAWYDVPYIYLVDSAIQRGISKEKASFLSAMVGILNTLGGVLLGFLGDLPWINPHLTYAVLMCLCGVCTGIIPLVTSYEGIAAAAGLFGLSIAANFSLTAIILVDLLSLDKFTNAYGLVLLLQGIGNLIGPPLAGWIFDETGDYDWSFYIAGAFVVLSGVILLVSPLYKLYKKPLPSSTQIKGTEL